jgi:hypothetical protein
MNNPDETAFLHGRAGLGVSEKKFQNPLLEGFPYSEREFSYASRIRRSIHETTSEMSAGV